MMTELKRQIILRKVTRKSFSRSQRERSGTILQAESNSGLARPLGLEWSKSAKKWSKKTKLKTQGTWA